MTKEEMIEQFSNKRKALETSLSDYIRNIEIVIDSLQEEHSRSEDLQVDYQFLKLYQLNKTVTEANEWLVKYFSLEGSECRTEG